MTRFRSLIATALILAAALLAWPPASALMVHPGTQGWTWKEPPPVLDCRFTINDCGMAYAGASTRMLWDSTGTLVYAEHNIQKRSEELDHANWSGNSISVTANAATAPDGATTADKVIPDDNTTSFVELYQNISVIDGFHYSQTYFVKEDDWRYVQIIGTSTGFGTFHVNFDTRTGTVTENEQGSSDELATASVEAFPNSWYRIKVTQVAKATGGSQRLALNFIASATENRGVSTTGDGSTGVLVWGAQFNQGPPLPYNITTTAAVYLPRIAAHTEISGADNLGFLVEAEARTKYSRWNRDQTNAVWVKTNMTTAKDATGLDGIANSASTLTASSANGTSLQPVTLSSDELTFALYVKRVTGSGDIDITLYADDLVTNGGFGSDADWTKGTGWTIASNVATKSAGSGTDLEQDQAVIEGISYEVIYTVTAVSAGTIKVSLAGTDGTVRSTAATFTETIAAGSGSNPRLEFVADSSFAGSIDNVSVIEIPTWTTLTGLSSSVYTPHSVTATVENPIFGVRIVTDTDAVEVDFADIEDGVFRTSVNETTTANVVRAPDVATMPLPAGFSETTMTYLVELDVASVSSAGTTMWALSVSDGGNNNAHDLAFENGTEDIPRVFVYSGGIARGNLAVSNTTANTLFKIAWTVAENDVAASKDAGNILTDTSVTPLPTGLNIIKIGLRGGGIDPFSGHIARIAMWNRRLINGRLQDKTAFLDWWKGLMYAANDDEPFDMIGVAA